MGRSRLSPPSHAPESQYLLHFSVGGSFNRQTGAQGHALLWNNGSVTDLGTLPGHSGSFATGINDSGEIVGYSFTERTTAGQTRAVVWDKGRISELPMLPCTSQCFSFAYAINERGQIVGSSGTGDGLSHAVLWQDGKVIDLGALPGDFTYSRANAINERGDIVGQSTNAQHFDNGVIWRKAR